MAITRAQADEIARNQLVRICADGRFEARIQPDRTMEEPFGWVYFYESPEFIATGNDRHSLLAAPPIVVDLEGGIHETGTRMPLRHYLEELFPPGR